MKMTNTTYYNLNIVEGTDIVNPLTVDNPNYEKIDETMHNNAVAGVTLATEIANSTVHAITRENSDCAVIRFIATSRWKAGDTATVDGVPVTALLPSGETLPDGAYVINANVLCILTGTNLTVYVEGNKVENANQISYNETNVGAELDKLNGSVVQINGSIEQINGSIVQINSNLKAVDTPILIANDTSKSYTIPSSLIDNYKKIQIIAINTTHNSCNEITMYIDTIKALGTGKTYINMTFSPSSSGATYVQASITYNSNGDIVCNASAGGSWTAERVVVYGFK